MKYKYIDYCVVAYFKRLTVTYNPNVMFAHRDTKTVPKTIVKKT